MLATPTGDIEMLKTPTGDIKVTDTDIKMLKILEILKSNIESESPTASRGGQGHFGKY